MDEQEKAIRETAARQKLESQAAAIAIATPRPGVLADVFKTQPDIEVGKYKVRPFYDLDFEFLQELGHPFATFAVGDTREIDEFVPRGPKAWQLFWIMTTPVVEVEALFKSGGVKGVEDASRAEFGQYQLGALFSIYKAVVSQLMIYAKSVVGYSASEFESDEKEASGKIPPQ
jgi:hypothetical protein